MLRNLFFGLIIAAFSLIGGAVGQQVFPAWVQNPNTGALSTQQAVTINNAFAVSTGQTVTLPLNAGTAATYACFTSGGLLISSATAC